MSGKIRGHIRGNVVGYVALFVALSGTAIALPGRNSVDSGDIRNGQVKRPDIARNAVNGARVAGDSLSGADLAPDSVTGSELAGDAVASGEVQPDSLLGSDIDEETLNVDDAAIADKTRSIWIPVTEINWPTIDVPPTKQLATGNTPALQFSGSAPNDLFAVIEAPEHPATVTATISFHFSIPSALGTVIWPFELKYHGAGGFLDTGPSFAGTATATPSATDQMTVASAVLNWAGISNGHVVVLRVRRDPASPGDTAGAANLHGIRIAYQATR